MDADGKPNYTVYTKRLRYTSKIKGYLTTVCESKRLGTDIIMNTIDD